jgi:hypothetical protein
MVLKQKSKPAKSVTFWTSEWCAVDLYSSVMLFQIIIFSNNFYINY